MVFFATYRQCYPLMLVKYSFVVGGSLLGKIRLLFSVSSENGENNCRLLLAIVAYDNRRCATDDGHVTSVWGNPALGRTFGETLRKMADRRSVDPAVSTSLRETRN